MTRLEVLVALREAARHEGSVLALSRAIGCNRQILYRLEYQLRELLGEAKSSQAMSWRPDVLNCAHLARYLGQPLAEMMVAFGLGEAIVLTDEEVADES